MLNIGCQRSVTRHHGSYCRGEKKTCTRLCYNMQEANKTKWKLTRHWIKDASLQQNCYITPVEVYSKRWLGLVFCFPPQTQRRNKFFSMPKLLGSIWLGWNREDRKWWKKKKKSVLLGVKMREENGEARQFSLWAHQNSLPKSRRKLKWKLVAIFGWNFPNPTSILFELLCLFLLCYFVFFLILFFCLFYLVFIFSSDFFPFHAYPFIRLFIYFLLFFSFVLILLFSTVLDFCF